VVSPIIPLVARVVLDTNVLVAALRSRNGASYRLLSLIDTGRYEMAVSVPLVLEYEAAAKRLVRPGGLAAADIDAVVDYICKVASQHKIYYLWRPFLRDPKDDMVLELAVGSSSEVIVTYNRRDFARVGQFGLRVLTPREFLREIGE
jgi:putative PIN family toxin of toxin-antitoxin system